MKKFLLAFLTIIALSGAVVMSHPSPALAFEPRILASGSREDHVNSGELRSLLILLHCKNVIC